MLSLSSHGGASVAAHAAEIAVLVPVYRNAASLPALAQRMASAMNE